MKYIPKANKSAKELKSLRSEIDILRSMNHENIVLMLDFFETSTDFVIVTEFCEGDLYEIIEDDKTLPEAEVQKIAKQLIRALVCGENLEAMVGDSGRAEGMVSCGPHTGALSHSGRGPLAGHVSPNTRSRCHEEAERDSGERAVVVACMSTSLPSAMRALSYALSSRRATPAAIPPQQPYHPPRPETSERPDRNGWRRQG